jgi:hypothetical protein
MHLLKRVPPRDACFPVSNQTDKTLDGSRPPPNRTRPQTASKPRCISSTSPRRYVPFPASSPTKLEHPIRHLNQLQTNLEQTPTDLEPKASPSPSSTTPQQCQKSNPHPTCAIPNGILNPTRQNRPGNTSEPSSHKNHAGQDAVQLPSQRKRGRTGGPWDSEVGTPAKERALQDRGENNIRRSHHG